MELRDWRVRWMDTVRKSSFVSLLDVVSVLQGPSVK